MHIKYTKMTLSKSKPCIWCHRSHLGISLFQTPSTSLLSHVIWHNWYRAKCPSMVHHQAGSVFMAQAGFHLQCTRQSPLFERLTLPPELKQVCVFSNSPLGDSLWGDKVYLNAQCIPQKKRACLTALYRPVLPSIMLGKYLKKHTHILKTQILKNHYYVRHRRFKVSMEHSPYSPRA